MTIRKYSSRAQQTTLSTGITSTATTMTVGSGANLMGGKTPAVGETYTVVIDPDTALEEIVDVSNYSSGNTLTIARGVDASTAVAHSAGAVVRHMVIGRDLQEANNHAEATLAGHAATTSTQLRGVISDETGTGSLVFGTSPTLVTPALGTPTAAVLTNATGLPLTTGVTGTLPVANGGTGVTTSTGTGANVLGTSPTIATPAITGGTISGTAITNVSAPSAGGDAANKTYVDGILGSATAASTSATAAANSATAAAASETSATASAASATSSASSATSSASTATTQASAASSSASNAATSATSASNSATTATTQATSATNSATSATASATSATASATSATNSATSATTSATNASNSYTAIVDQTGKGLVRDMGSIADADTTTDTYIGINALVSTATTKAANAATSATTATTQASNASTSATAAAASAASAAASYDSFDDRYLGPKASAPSVDNDGNALLTGALYFDTTTPGMYVWTGSAWTVMATSGDIESVTAGTGLSGGGTAGAVTVSLNTSSIYVVPSQTGSSGYFLTTNGTAASWVNLSDWGAL